MLKFTKYAIGFWLTKGIAKAITENAGNYATPNQALIDFIFIVSGLCLSIFFLIKMVKEGDKLLRQIITDIHTIAESSKKEP